MGNTSLLSGTSAFIEFVSLNAYMHSVVSLQLNNAAMRRWQLYKIDILHTECTSLDTVSPRAGYLLVSSFQVYGGRDTGTGKIRREKLQRSCFVRTKSTFREKSR